MNLASLCLRIAFFLESDTANRAPIFFLAGACDEKKKCGRGSQRSDTSELTLVPHASLSPHREVSPVLFSHPDQCPSAFMSDMVLFGGSEEDLQVDSMSLAASDMEDWTG